MKNGERDDSRATLANGNATPGMFVVAQLIRKPLRTFRAALAHPAGVIPRAMPRRVLVGT